MNYKTELKEILQNLSKSTIPGKEVTTLDVVLKILEKYYMNADVEDIAIVIFIKENYEDRKKFSDLIDSLTAFQSTWQGRSNDLTLTISKAEDLAKKIPLEPNRESVSTVHFLLAALEETPELEEIFKSFGAGKTKLFEAFESGRKNYEGINNVISEVIEKFFPRSMSINENNGNEEFSFLESMGFPLSGGELEKKPSSSKIPMLDKYAKDLTAETTDPVYGREGELIQLLEILGCKKKNNAILIGEPGTGKTSVVELLAQRIRDKKVPRPFLNRKIYQLDLNSLVAGTKYRGQYEERLQGIIEEVVSHPEIIVFIDEIHNLIGNGGSDGNGDAANILKPYLAKGKFQCIGSTTFKEYRKYIEKDGALKRRFQNIRIDEPSSEETKIILGNIKKVYESHHNVTYPKEVIEACVDLSGRYLPDRYFPDKAIDALDLSGSLTRLSSSTASTPDYLALEEEMMKIREKKIKGVQNCDLDTALGLRDKERELQGKMETKEGPIKVTLEDVYKAIGKRSGVPLESIGASDLDKLRKLNAILPTQVIGQEKAIKEVIMSLQKNSLSIRDPQKPIASLLFVGPTGSGKTYLCKSLAREFFGSEDALIKYDMSEYGEKHEVTKLTGASASFVGYDDEPGFELVRKHPYSVVLFDEIEKAAPEIYQIFLSILDEGYITLANGTRVNFKNTIIIFTGNIGTKELSLFGGGVGYGSTPGTINNEKKDQIIHKSVKKTFSPEFINRLSKIVIFNSLGKPELLKIADLEIKKLSDRLKGSKIVIKVSKALKEYIVSGCDQKYGARDLQRGISKHIEETICEELLSPDIPDGKKVFSLDYKNGKVIIELKKKKEEEKNHEA